MIAGASVKAYEAGPQLALGTAQLKGAYGLLSDGTIPKDSQALTLLGEARHLGLSAVDTAPAYPHAEELIGRSPWTGPVWTKFDARLNPEESIARSLIRLNRDAVDIVFVHDLTSLWQMSRAARRALESLRGSVTARLGVSVYEPHELTRALDLFPFDVAQVPINAFDQRFPRHYEEGQLPTTCSYVARSVFLQGILAQPEAARSHVVPELRMPLERWTEFCRQSGMHPGQAALTYVQSQNFASAIIVGGESAEQLRTIAQWSRATQSQDRLRVSPDFDQWPASDPRCWKRQSETKTTKERR